MPFICDHCHASVSTNTGMAVQNRNHCPTCLWSKHVDDQEPGDRKSLCEGLMEPIGLTFKKTKNKYKEDSVGELMLIHICRECGKININRIAADDNTDTILEIFVASLNVGEEIQESLKKHHIRVLKKEDKNEILTQLFGTKQ